MPKLLANAPVDEVEMRVPAEDEERVVVYETDFQDDADLLCEHLEARGTPCDVVEARSAMQKGGRGDRDLYYKVVVWSADERLATDLIVLSRNPDTVAEE